RILCFLFFFFFNTPALTYIYTLSLHDALPILALKILSQTSFDTETLRHFEHEFLAMTKLLHPNLVAVHDFGIVEIADEPSRRLRSEEHTSELQSRFDLVCRLLLEKKKTIYNHI